MRLSVVDVQGRELTVLAAGTLEPGVHRAKWSGETPRGRAAAGIYFARLEVDGAVYARRVAWVR